MRYFRIRQLGDESDRERIIVDKRPEGLDGWDFVMAQGERIGDKYPGDAKVYLRDQYPGIKLTDFISNTVAYMITSDRMMSVIKANANVEIEYLPLAIYNHRKRLHAANYWIINPIGTTDCLDLAASDVIRGEETGQITMVNVYAFSRRGLGPKPPSILRVKETPWEIFVDEPTARTFHQQQMTNIQIDIVPCS
jgi:hypothetical protein